MSEQLYDQWQEALQRARKAEQQLAESKSIRGALREELDAVRGYDLPVALRQRDELEQQLAEAHAKIARQEAEIRILAAQRQDYKATASNACALLWEVLDNYEAFDNIKPRVQILQRKIRAFLGTKQKD